MTDRAPTFGSTKEDISVKDIPPKVTKPRATSLEGRLLGFITSIGTVVAIADEFDGRVIIERADSLATNLDKWAKESPKVKKALESMLTGSVATAVIIDIGAMLIPILAHHNLLPAQLTGMIAQMEDMEEVEKYESEPVRAVFDDEDMEVLVSERS